MTCKDCIGYQMCRDKNHLAWHEARGNEITLKDNVENKCEYFKNKADFVEVVRCRECKHCEIWNNDWFFCKKTVNDAEVTADDFCSYGERREVCRGK